MNWWETRDGEREDKGAMLGNQGQGEGKVSRVVDSKLLQKGVTFVYIHSPLTPPRSVPG